MSTAKSMSRNDRIGHYLAQNRTPVMSERDHDNNLLDFLTPRQRRRVRSKENEARRPHARTGRLRRRYDRREDRRIRQVAQVAAQLVRLRRGRSLR